MGVLKNSSVKSFTLNFCVTFFRGGGREEGSRGDEMPINISKQIRLTYELLVPKIAKSSFCLPKQ
jgi:hypothetical protein